MTNYSYPNATDWLGLIGWANDTVSGLLIPGLILTIGTVIFLRMVRNNNEVSESFLTAVLITFVLTLFAAALTVLGVPLIGFKWIAFEIALLILALISYYM